MQKVFIFLYLIATISSGVAQALDIESRFAPGKKIYINYFYDAGYPYVEEGVVLELAKIEDTGFYAITAQLVKVLPHRFSTSEFTTRFCESRDLKESFYRIVIEESNANAIKTSQALVKSIVEDNGESRIVFEDNRDTCTGIGGRIFDEQSWADPESSGGAMRKKIEKVVVAHEKYPMLEHLHSAGPFVAFLYHIFL